ncbi:hypothetical protein BJF81_15680 [Ornithinimicrobium sp. CNJ-824]|uniref:helix-turn-helix transcriptional regulator n=1 Tax=Ornithinimicrobium sp. CNJ-824 TaxID=1904966 RepID=UPI00096098E5|nr:helix-turn-helix transcriptional regulator [Ornithinimicrobium sp. CNJ-824]OLT21163.1 hypothetical protein BJF81_15680 [Ornithinimicrobium sp. CNJ-824]
MTESREQVRARAEALADWHTELMEGLVELRERHGLTQDDVAKRMGVSQPAVSQLERAEANPTLLSVRRYALAVGARLRTEVISDLEPVHVAQPEGSRSWTTPRTVDSADVSWGRAVKDTVYT